MHGLVNRAIQCFVRDSYGLSRWLEVTRQAGVEVTDFEAMLHYDDAITENLINAAKDVIGVSEETVLEDLGTYLVTHPNVEALRRLLRFGGVDFVDFLHSLDELPDRAKLAVDDLDLPSMEVRQHSTETFSLTLKGERPGFGYVMMGILRTLADDYGALVLLEHRGAQADVEVIDITLVEQAFASGREFELGAWAG